MTDNAGKVDAVLFKRWTDAVALREAMTELKDFCQSASKRQRNLCNSGLRNKATSS